MNPLLVVGLMALACVAGSSRVPATAEELSSAPISRKDLNEEMQLINKSLEGLLGELAAIRREATGRLSQVKSKLAPTSDQERIRQTKVSRFVLKRVAELELESLGMRDEMMKLFDLQKKTLTGGSESATTPASGASGLLLLGRTGAGKQEDVDFEEAPRASSATTSAPSGTTTTTSLKPGSEQEQEAAQIGFDLEQLKRLGSELESEVEARQAQGAESVRGVHEQVIRLVDNMVQNYLGNMRRAVQRFNNFVDNTRSQATSSQPRHQSAGVAAAPAADAAGTPNIREAGVAIVGQLEGVSKRFREFTMQWSKTLGKQQSPLFDRIPPRGVELWRDFWDTVRKQVRRINEEFWQLSRDMGRVLTGRQPSTGSRIVIRPGGREQDQEGAEVAPPLLYYSPSAPSRANSRDQSQEQIRQQFEQFYEKLTVQLAKEQAKMNELGKTGAADGNKPDQSLFDELDDEITRQELKNNVALRQQIQQEIDVFGSIFDIMRAFIARLRDSASTIRDILTPPGAIFDNNPVTPSSAVKPTVDKIIEETINSQRNINSQARPTSRD